MATEEKNKPTITESGERQRLPTFFVSHGGGPCFFMEDESDGLFSEMDKNSEPTKFYKNFFNNAKLDLSQVKGILVVSAHWEESRPTVQTHPNPPLYYDYYGFPQETYELKYPAPGNPKLAKQVVELLRKANFETAENNQRGFDHGVFIPLKLMIPEANIPIIQLSIMSNLDGKKHIELGQALASLRDQGILIIASGQATHNLGATRIAQSGAGVQQYVKDFVGWTTDVVTSSKYSQAERLKLLEGFRKAPSIREAHPRAEHFIPLLVAAGAAGGEQGKILYDKVVVGGHMSLACYQFGGDL